MSSSNSVAALTVVTVTHAVTGNHPADEILFEESYRRLLPEFKALQIEELAPINLDIPSVVTTVLGVGPQIAALAGRIAKELPEFDLQRIHALDAYAMALSHAHTLFLMGSQRNDSLPVLIEEGRELRQMLVADANALVRRGHVNGHRLKDLKGPRGYKNLAVDLQILAALLRDSLAQISGKSGTQPEELRRAEQIAARVLRLVGIREQGAANIAATADMRVRAFTLLTRCYDQARRAVTYLRWNEADVESIAPSLFAGRGGRKRASSDKALTVATPTSPGSGASGSPTADAAISKPGAASGGGPVLGASSPQPFLR